MILGTVLDRMFHVSMFLKFKQNVLRNLFQRGQMIIYYYFFARRKNLIQKYFPRRPIKRLANALHWIKAFSLNSFSIDKLLLLNQFQEWAAFCNYCILTNCWYRFQSILLSVLLAVEILFSAPKWPGLWELGRAKLQFVSPTKCLWKI